MTTSKYPDACLETGLSCETCTESTARELSRACPGLSGKLVRQLFVQIHIHAACARMHSHFARAYAEAGVPSRKPAGSVRAVAAAAVA